MGEEAGGSVGGTCKKKEVLPSLRRESIKNHATWGGSGNAESWEQKGGD